MGPFYCPGDQQVCIDLTLCDALQQPSRGTVRPETFTHGSSAQRVSWFKRGMASGRMADCHTFEARQP